jgi:RNA-binding motif protein, X-linked 2
MLCWVLRFLDYFRVGSSVVGWMNVVQEIHRITERELEMGIVGGIDKGSWHERYDASAWVFTGGLPIELSEGDLLCVMSQWGELEDINLVRDKSSGKSKGYAFLKYLDQKSTILAVDNCNGIELLKRTIRCDHVEQYKLPKEIREKSEKEIDENPNDDLNIGPGHAYANIAVRGDFDIKTGQDLWAPSSKYGSDAVVAAGVPPFPSSSSRQSSNNNQTDINIFNKEEKKRKKEDKKKRKEAKKKEKKEEKKKEKKTEKKRVKKEQKKEQKKKEGKEKEKKMKKRKRDEDDA